MMKIEDYTTKKVWVYCIKELPFKDVYAFTFNKKIAKRFEKQRNMKKFSKSKMYLDELEEMYENFIFSHKIHEIQEYPLYDGVEDIMILSTQMEMNAVNGVIDSLEEDANKIKRCLQSDYCVFNKKTKKFLLELLQISVTDENGDLVSNINSFHIFIKQFGHMMKM